MERLVKLLLVMAVMMFVGTGTILGAARLTYHNPLAPYLAIMPGNSIEAIEDYPCPLVASMSSGVEVSSCEFDPKDGRFSSVTVIKSKQVIVRIAFDVQPNRLHFGDLVLCWGAPMYVAENSKTEAPILNMYWGNQVHARVVPRQSSRQASYFLPVAALSIEREWHAVEPEKVSCA